MIDSRYLFLLTKCYSGHCKYKPKLREYFRICRYQLNFSMLCSTKALSTLWQHLNHPNLLVRSVYQFHLYFHVRIILYHLSIALSHEHGFIMVERVHKVPHHNGYLPKLKILLEMVLKK